LDTSDAKIQTLQREVHELEQTVSHLRQQAEKTEENLGHSLLKQIEVLAVFAVFLSLAITNVIGIDVLGSLGLRGLMVIDLSYVASAFLLLLGIKWLILGGKR